MKKTISILSLSMLLFTALTPWFIHAEEPEELINQGNETPEEITTSEHEINNNWEWIINENQNNDNENSDNEYTNDENNNDITEEQKSKNQEENNSETNTDLLNNNSQLWENNDNRGIANTDPDFDWENCFERNWPYIKKYICDETDIIIPESAKWVFWEAFAWKTINNITFQSTGTTLYQQIFSGAVLQWTMTLPWENPDQGYLFEWATIWEEWVITINKWMRTYHTNILWTVIVNWSDWGFNNNYLFQNSYIDGTVILSWFIWQIQYWFYWATITENWKIIIWEWITQIYNSFQRVNWEWEIYWEIIFPESLESIWQSFYWIPIDSHIDFPKGLKKINHSFYVSYNYPITFQSWLYFTGNESLEIEDAFDNAKINWDYSIIWSWISLKNSSPANISWNVIISWENIKLQSYSFYNTQNWGTKIDWNVIISWNNINEMRWFTSAKISEDFKIIWNNININYWLWWQARIKWDFTISWNNIESKYGSTSTLNVSWDIIITGDSIDFGYSFLTPSNIDWNIKIKGNDTKLMYTALNNSKIWWNINIESNSTNLSYWSLDNINVGWYINIESITTTIWYNTLENSKIWWLINITWEIEFLPWALTGTEVEKLILNKVNTKLQPTTLTWDLIINNSDNMFEEAFSWVSISNNIYLNWEISKVWEAAYAFKSWNIQPITLSSNYNTWDIGEYAFCVGTNIVTAYTKKIVSQAEKDYLLEHACLDVKGAFNLTFNVDWNTTTILYNWRNTDEITNPNKNGYEFLWWYEENSETPFDFKNTLVTEDKTFYAHWKSLVEKTEETTTENVVYTNTTTVTVWEETTEEALSWSSTLTLVSKEVENSEVTTEEETTKVQDSEIKVTSDKTVEYEWWLEVYLEKTENVGTENETTGKVEWTIKFSAPVAVKIPIASDVEYVKVQVKHWDEDFGFKWLTLNPVNECNNWEAVNNKYNGENVEVKNINGDKYATIYTCSASTFVAYTETKKPVEILPSAWGGRSITTKQESNVVTEQEHNSADIVEPETTQTSSETVKTPAIEEQVKKIEWRSLTRWEVAIMTNILLEVYPQLVEWKQELDDVTNACSNYVDEQNFTKDEKKAITRLCKLSIMWIHNDTNKPLEEFLVNSKSTNDEFSKVINRSIETYNEKDLSTIKDALKKLEWDEENVVFGTVYDVFMSIKTIFN